MLSSIKTLTVCVIGILLISSTNVYSATIFTDNFDNGLTGWYNVNDVTIVDTGSPYGNVALLNDSSSIGFAHMNKHFYIPLNTNIINISFDYLFTGNGGTPFVADYFASNLAVRVNNPFMFPIYKNINVVSITSNDIYFGTIVHYTGSIDISDVGDYNPNAYLSFSLLEGSYMDCGDTKVYLDNINITTTPIPSSLYMLITGVICLVGFKRK